MSTSVCVCLSVHVDISGTMCVIFTKFLVHVACGRGSVLLRRRCKIPRERAILGVFFPIDISLYCMAFGTHTKTAELIEMLFGMMSGLGPRNCVTVYYVGVTISEGEGAILRKTSAQQA